MTFTSYHNRGWTVGQMIERLQTMDPTLELILEGGEYHFTVRVEPVLMEDGSTKDCAVILEGPEEV